MTDSITVRVRAVDGVTVQVQEKDLVNAQTNSYNVPTIPNLNDILDVDATNPDHGSVLVYKTNNSKWTATTTLDLQNMEGGEY